VLHQGANSLWGQKYKAIKANLNRTTKEIIERQSQRNVIRSDKQESLRLKIEMPHSKR